MKQTIIAILALAAGIPTAQAGHYDMLRWGADRGYTDAPYFRYEAEKDYCDDYRGEYLEATDDQRFLQSEASNQQAITLNRDGYVTWTNDSGDADGVTLRFSVPWGTSATVAIKGSDGATLGEMTLNTDHSWEYCNKIQGSRTNKPEIYSVHIKNDNEFVRMRFDETHTRLSRDIRDGETFSITNLSDTPVTVDFLEIEKTQKVAMQDGWVRWDRNAVPNLQDFINNNQGRTIYIDEPYVGIHGKLSVGNATLQGSGMWYTELHWEQDGAGFHGFDGAVKDMYLSSYQNQRYFANDHSAGGYGSPGKCFNDRVGNVERVWVEHFECGAWLSGANGARFSHCRFRNNYADGINLCNSSNSVVEHCSFRNNGDDDMASWSAEQYASNNTYRYCTAEHNWRASSLGFFGGGGHKAHNILIKDGLENGARLCADFPGPAYGNEGIFFKDITIVHCACIDGPVGQNGDFWGVNEGALHIEASKNYSIPNASFENIDILDSRGNAVFIGSSHSLNHRVDNLQLKNIRVDGVADPGSYAFYFENPRGSATISDVVIDNVPDSQLTNFNGGHLESGSSEGFTLSVSGVSSTPAEPVEGCELSLIGLHWEGPDGDILREGDKVTFSARIFNHSEVGLPQGYPLSVTLDFGNGNTVPFPVLNTPLASQADAIVTTTWTATAGGHTVAAVLDASNRYGAMTPADKGKVEKKINVEEIDYLSLPFETTSGVDFQPLGLVWAKEGSNDFGRGEIREGDRIVLAAVVANTGTQNSEGGSKLGVILSPSGNGWTQGDNDLRWSDQNEAYDPLNAGETKFFRAYGGNNNSDGVWTARNGSFNVLVHVNDHANEDGNRREDNTSNNQAHYPLTIPYVPKPMHDTPDEPDNLSAPTGVNLCDADVRCDDCWYTISGVCLQSRPTVPGLYIHAGHKILIK